MNFNTLACFQKSKKIDYLLQSVRIEERKCGMGKVSANARGYALAFN